MAQIPVILLAFANDKSNEARFLRNLDKEQQLVRQTLRSAIEADLCELHIITDATIAKVVEAFQSQELRNRIAIFHFAGHAGSYHLAMESADGQVELAHAKGFAAFLGSQQGLQLVFLNGCSTEKQVTDLLDAKVGAVIATSQSIDDEAAMKFSSTFYQSLSTGDGLDISFQEASAVVQIHKGSSFRDLYIPEMEAAPDRFPWNMYIRNGAEVVKDWNLPDASDNPLFGLPQLPDRPLPESPFRYLKWYRKEDAEVFFGRAYQIRDLYDKVKNLMSETREETTKRINRPNVIHLYGRSGVGKSSLLAAGLFPRLEKEYDVLYLRRKPSLGLWKTLCEGLKTTTETPTKILEAWIQKESEKPLMIILDQVEEVFTRPNPQLQDELESFVANISRFWQDNTLKGKLLLAYRKEYLAEIEDAFKKHKLAFSTMFLENLKRTDIIQAVLGLTKSERLQQKYQLQVEAELPEMIANDLTEDQDAAVAPVLQILLSSFWEKAKAENPDQPHFNRNTYVPLKESGLGMRDFLITQLMDLQNVMPEALETGWVLDVLNEHISNKGTSSSMPLDELNRIYAHLKSNLPKLLNELKLRYLLIDPKENSTEAGKQTRLAHDTLAPIVKDLLADSNNPSAQAKRILKSRLTLNRDPKNLRILSEDELATVEQGQKGMRSWTPDEQHLVYASLAIHNAYRNQTQSFRYAKKAWLLNPNRLSERAINRAYHISILYEDFMPDSGIIHKAIYAPDGKLLVAYVDAKATLFNPEGTPIANLGKLHMVNHARFSPDSKFVGTIDQIGTVRIWDAQTGEIFSNAGAIAEVEGIRQGERLTSKLRAVGARKQSVLDLSFLPDGSGIVIMRLYEGIEKVSTNNTKSMIYKSKGLVDGAFSADGSTAVVITEDGHLERVLLSGQRIKTQKHTTTKAEHVAISPNGKYAYLLDRPWLRIWDLEEYSNEPASRKGFQSGIKMMAFSPKGDKIAVLLGDGTSWLLDKNGQFLLKLEGYVDDVNSFSFNHKTGDLLMVADRKLYNWKVEAGVFKSFFHGRYPIQGLAWHPEGEKVIFTYGSFLCRYYPEYRKVYEIGPQNEVALTSMELSANGQKVISAAENGFAYVYDLQSEERICLETESREEVNTNLSNRAEEFLEIGKTALKEFKWFFNKLDKPIASIKAVATNQHGTTFVTGQTDGSLFIWDENGKVTARVRGYKETESINKFARAAEEGLFTSAVQTDMPVSDLSDKLAAAPLRGELAKKFKGHTDDVNGVAITPDGNFFVSGASDHRVGCWNMKGESLWLKIFCESPVTTVAISPDGNWLAIGDQAGKVGLWDLQGNQSWRIQAHAEPVRKVRFSPNSTQILSTSQDETCATWDLHGARILRIRSFMNWVFDAGFAPDGKSIATASSDNIIRFWQLDVEKILADNDDVQPGEWMVEDEDIYGRDV